MAQSWQRLSLVAGMVLAMFGTGLPRPPMAVIQMAPGAERLLRCTKPVSIFRPRYLRTGVCMWQGANMVPEDRLLKRIIRLRTAGQTHQRQASLLVTQILKFYPAERCYRHSYPET